MNLIDWAHQRTKDRGRSILVMVLVIVGFVLGYYLLGSHDTNPASVDSKEAAAVDGHDHSKEQREAKRATLWTCSMHPQIRLHQPGKCPICFMDLIPLEDDKAGADITLAQYSMSEGAKKLAEVQTERVKRERAKVQVRMVGMVAEDETRVAALTSRVDGRLDEIYVNFTGVAVNKGDPMVKIWSPTLIKSQVELFETIRSREEDPGVLKGAEEKLIQLGVTQEQIDQIKARKKPDLYVTLRAPINGVVLKKMAVLGQFVKEGQEMYMINDLSNVWIKLDAYETDMPWIRYGQEVRFTTPAVPGRTFIGRVLFIDPMLTTMTRSVKIRVEAENPELLLKPGMFVTGELEAEVDQSGRIIKSEWAGKYICPVHPKEEASSEPGICPESKMPLRPASSFGYADEKNPVSPLVIPASAPLITGKRAIVYVEVPGADRPTYEGREVVLGPKAGDKYVVYQGLKEDERVVTKGNFKIDSAMQILAKSSMMSPAEPAKAKAPELKQEEEVIEKVKAPTVFLRGLTPVIEEYLSLKDSLVEGMTDEAASHAEKLDELMQGVKVTILGEKAKQVWTGLAKTIVGELKKIAETKELESQRKAFDPLSEAFAKVVMGFRHVMNAPLVVFHCPMAFNQKGAYWVEGSEERRNPYFGRAPFKGQDMLQCSELVEKVPPETASSEGKAQAGSSSDTKTAKGQEGSESKPAGGDKGPPEQAHEGHEHAPGDGKKGDK
ncbi:MAG: efflux RND transporter periplasmic adaptor subunit [Desulfomonile tiedjei]|nr:efflux RND transporter periplasmic adaptor subunit [Desulfomonile tiedjei]